MLGVVLGFVFFQTYSDWQTISGMGVGLKQNQGCLKLPVCQADIPVNPFSGGFSLLNVM